MCLMSFVAGIYEQIPKALRIQSGEGLPLGLCLGAAMENTQGACMPGKVGKLVGGSWGAQ